MTKAEQIYEKVRSLPEPSQSAVLRMVEGISNGAHASSAEEQARLARTFQDLLETWRRETWFLSHMQQRVLHPAYQRMIGMGWAAVPFTRQCGRWARPCAFAPPPWVAAPNSS